MGWPATLATIVVGILLCLFAAVFLRALTARLMTGKWPHQDAESKAIYDHLTETT